MSNLNGAYYGPAALPEKSYRPGRRGGGGGCCCNPFTCCCGCLMNCICTCLCQIIITILVIAGIIVFIGWLIFRPNTIKFHASDASLTEFSLNNNNTLHYNLALNLTIRNPNRRVGIYYDRIEARASYQGQRFSTVNLTRFYQGHKSTDYASAVFRGQQVVVLGNRELTKFNDDRTAGAFDIDVKLYLRIRMKFGFVKSMTVKPNIDCDLRVPLSTNGTVLNAYEPRRCDFDWR